MSQLVLGANGEVSLEQDSPGASGGMMLVPDDRGEISLKKYDPNALAPSTIATRRALNEPVQPAPYRPVNAVDQALEEYRANQQAADIENPLRNLSPTGSGVASFAKEYGDTLLGAPSSIADLASYPFRYAAANPAQGPMVGRGSYNLIPGTPTGPQGEVTRPAADVPMYGYAPRLTTGDVGAAMASRQVGGMENAQERYQTAEQAREAQHPIATEVGTTAADLFALSQARSPFAVGTRVRAGGLASELEKAQKLSGLRSKIVTGATEAELKANALTRIAASPAWIKLQRGTGRVVESLGEGAVLGMLQERDPIKSAAYTAGSQAAFGGATGALLHNWARGAFPKAGGAVSLSANIAVLSGMAYMAGLVLPGQVKDYEAQKQAAQKIVGTWLVGMTTGALSGRARTGKTSAYVPRLIDALASSPRNTLQLYLTKFLGADEAGRRVMMERLQQLQEKFPSLNDEQTGRLNSAYNRGSAALDTEMKRIFGQ